MQACSSVLSTSTGSPAFEKAVQTASRFDVSLREHRATDLAEFEYRKGDLLAAMEVSHVKRLLDARIANASTRRQHPIRSIETEQMALIGFGERLLVKAEASSIATFSAGGFDADRAIFSALAKADLDGFVSMSHNFELLKPGLSEPDRSAVRRFTRLCEFQQSRSSTLNVNAGMRYRLALGQAAAGPTRVPLHARAHRFAQQALRPLA